MLMHNLCMYNRTLYTYINICAYCMGSTTGRRCAHCVHGLAISLGILWHVVFVDAYQYFIGSYESFLLIVGSHLLRTFFSFHFMYFTFHWYFTDVELIMYTFSI